MKRLIAISAIIFCATAVLKAQGFPDAQKQPKPVEMHKNQKKYKHMSKRHHVSHQLDHDKAAPRKRT